MSVAGSSPQQVEIGGHRLRLTNLDKVLYPRDGTTKAEVVRWYADAAPALAPYAQLRPVTRKRWPDGVAAASFFEKNLPAGTPDWVERVTLPHTERDITYPLIPADATGALATLVWFAQSGALELHVPQWQVSDGVPQPPDRIVIDLDPGPGAGLDECGSVALDIRARMAADGLHAVPVTSGSKGMQLYAAVPGSAIEGASTEIASEYVKQLAQALTKERPDDVVWRMTKDLRPGKVFLDWSQNNGRKTTIAPWSLRGRDHAFVATPRTWDEVEDGGMTHLTIPQARERLADPDPLAALSRTGRS
jgi:bifunctional non-homologous end joining protein LigD